MFVYIQGHASLQSTYLIMRVQFVQLFSSYYCITCVTHVCHVLYCNTLWYIVTCDCMYVIFGTYVVIVTVFNYGPNLLADPYAMPLHQLLYQMMPVWRHIFSSYRRQQ